MNSIHTLIPGTIQEFDAVKMEASVIPLSKPVISGKEIEPQLIERCPVCFLNDSTFSVRHPLKKGDLVIIGFSEVSLENLLNENVSNSVKNTKKFNITDGIILGTIDSETDEMISEFSDDLLLINKKTGHKVVFKEDGSLFTTVEIISAPNATTISAPNATVSCKKLIASDDVVGGGISLKEHTHSYRPGSGGPTPTDKPK